jgi:hypothetical protein
MSVVWQSWKLLPEEEKNSTTSGRIFEKRMRKEKLGTLDLNNYHVVNFAFSSGKVY